MGTTIFDSVNFSLESGLLFESFNLVNNFSTVSARDLIFHMSIYYARHFFGTNIFTVWPWPSSFTFFLKTRL